MESIIGCLCCKKISLECIARKTFDSPLPNSSELSSILPTKRRGPISHEDTIIYDLIMSSFKYHELINIPSHL